jgi:hypothetical protein
MLAERRNPELGNAADAPVESEDDDAPDTVEGSCSPPQDLHSAEPAGPEAVAGSLAGHGIRELVKAKAAFEASRQSRKENDAPDTPQKSHPQPQDPPAAGPSDAEGDVSGPTGRDKFGPGRAAAGLQAARPSREAPVESQEDDTRDIVEAPYPRGWPAAERADAAGPGTRGNYEPGKAVAGPTASQQIRYGQPGPVLQCKSRTRGNRPAHGLSWPAQRLNMVEHFFAEIPKANQGPSVA